MLIQVLFTNENASQILLLGKGRGRCVALWERDHGIDPFQVLATKHSEIDPNDAWSQNNTITVIYCFFAAQCQTIVFASDMQTDLLQSSTPTRTIWFW